MKTFPLLEAAADLPSVRKLGRAKGITSMEAARRVFKRLGWTARHRAAGTKRLTHDRDEQLSPRVWSLMSEITMAAGAMLDASQSPNVTTYSQRD